MAADAAGIADAAEVAARRGAPGVAAPCAESQVATLRGALQAAAAIEGVDGAACAALRERLDAGIFHLVVAGEFKRGKSTVVNALLGREVLPVGVLPLTAVPTLIAQGDADGATVRFREGREAAIGLAQLAEYVTEAGNPGNAKGVAQVLVRVAGGLRPGVRIVDTPGIGSVHQHNTEAALAFLPQADAVLFVVSADQPLGRAEIEFLRELRQHAPKVLCVLNKADLLAGDERRQALDFVTRTAREAIGAELAVLPLSARAALAAGQAGDADALRRSGLGALREQLERLFDTQAQALLVASLAGKLRRLLARAELAARLELAALAAPLEQLEAQLAAFERHGAEARQAMDDHATLLDAEARALLRQHVEPELARFAAALQAPLHELIERRCAESPDLAPGALQGQLEAAIEGEIRRRVDAWRRTEEAELATRFDALCARFWQRVQELADRLAAVSTDPFGVEAPSLPATSAWQPRSGFSYKFWSAPPSIALIASAAVSRLPRSLALPLLRRRALAQAADLIDTQAGRLRHDFEQRLRASAQEFRVEMGVALAATVEAIEGALQRGQALRGSAATALDERRAALAQRLAQLAAIDAGLSAELSAATSATDSPTNLPIDSPIDSPMNSPVVDAANAAAADASRPAATPAG